MYEELLHIINYCIIKDSVGIFEAEASGSVPENSTGKSRPGCPHGAFQSAWLLEAIHRRHWDLFDSHWLARPLENGGEVNEI